MSLDVRVDELRQAGVARFDAGDLAFLEALLTRAEQASPGARARLRDRAKRHLFSLELRFEAARRDARAAIDALALRAPEAAEKAREALAQGDVQLAKRMAARALSRLSSAAWTRAADRLSRVLALAVERCQPAPPEVARAKALLASPDAESDAVRRAHALANALTLALLTEAAERSFAQAEVDRLQRQMPVEAGPYNPEALSAKALDEIASLSPTYLRAYLAYVGDLESLVRLPPAPSETTKPEKGRRGRKR